MHYFNKTDIGYSHINSGKICQDFSASYHDKERTIVTACDGHGGKIYIRSDLGSKFASNALMNVLKDVNYYSLRGGASDDYLNKLKLSILVEWNRRVEEHLNRYPIKKFELKELGDDEINKLKNNPERAYGTTMIGSLQIGNKLLVVHLGDGESILVRKGEIEPVFNDDEDEPVANMTYSMCAEDAYNHIKIRVIDFNDYDGIIICTDGVVNPYQNYDNFNNSMVKPLVHDLLLTKSTNSISEFVTKLESELGIGDDVSLSFIIKEEARERNYR